MSSPLSREELEARLALDTEELGRERIRAAFDVSAASVERPAAWPLACFSASGRPLAEETEMTVREAVDTVTSLLVRPEIMEQGVEPVGGQLAEIGPQARRTGQDQPRVAVGTALAFGYLLGHLQRM